MEDGFTPAAMDEAAEVLAEDLEWEEEEVDRGAMTSATMGHAQPRPSHMGIFLPFYPVLHR